MKIYVIRHGLPDYEHDCLTPDGTKQAFKLGEKYKNISFDAFYISTQGRACETAKPLLKYHQNAIVNYVDWAREDYCGKYFSAKVDGKFQWYWIIPEWVKLFRTEEVALYGNNWVNHPKIAKTDMPKGFKIMSESVDSFMLELGYEHDRVNHSYKKIKDNTPENVAVIAHGGFAFAFISNLLDIPYPEFTTTHCGIDCTAVTILEIWDGIPTPVIIKYNDTSHLDKDIEFKEVGI